MEKVSLSNKVFTENPLLDEIVYNARQIIYGGVVIKDADKADNNETLESITNGDVLVAVNSGSAHFFTFKYDKEFLETWYSSDLAKKYADDNHLIPQDDRAKIFKKASELFVANYEELNNYYRMLAGLPNYDEDGIYEGLWIDTRYIDLSTPTSIDHVYYMLPVGEEAADYCTLIHKLDLGKKNELYENGTCENITNETSTLASWGMSKDDAMYLMHIGDREVDPYNARVADKFALLYCPSCDSEEVKIRFKDLFEANRLYMLYTIYSSAYKYRSDYYDNFMMIFLIIQTVIDMIVELPNYIIRRDIFDTRTCKYIFESNGVKYFKDIPLKYQISLVKNLNKLIKFKSTDKCIVDIISIFGTENIEVFRYYILKDRNVKDPLKLDYYDNKKEVTDTLGNTTEVEDNETNYELRFIKVPMLEEYDDYIRTNKNIYGYDTVANDDYWIGDQDYKTVKNDIKDLDFTVLRSKYYSIEAVIDLAKRNFTVSYFMNILMYNTAVSTADLRVQLPNISTKDKFNIIDAIITLFSLGYIYYGVEDTILDSRAKVAQILGFNVEADMSKISSWLEENHLGLTLKDMHIDTFQTVEQNKITTFDQLQNIFLTNKDCYDHVVSVLNNPPSKDIYDAYKYIYRTLMTTNRNMEYFLTERSVVDQYESLGYKAKFINIPRDSQYHKAEDYYRDYKWLIEATEYTDLCFDMDDDFDNNHKFNLYIKEEGKTELTLVGTATMAYTYKEYLASKSDSSAIYSFLMKILSITNVEDRQEACVNAIQAIVSYLKDYIDQNGDDAIPLDTVFSGLPSISIDFIKKYVEEVIDFFKSFKIFTHGSSIMYVIQGKFENYVQLVEKILLKYLLDKSELVRIEDAIGPQIKLANGKLVYSGDGMKTHLTTSEKHELIDKVWFDIFTWVEKNYSEYYNSTNYEQTQERIKDYMERYSTYILNDTAFNERYIKEIQNYAVDAILEMLVDMTKTDYMEIKESIATQETHGLEDYYSEWMTDLMSIVYSMTYDDHTTFQDDTTRFTTHDEASFEKLIDKRYNENVSMTLNGDDSSMSDDLYTIITQTFPAHSFDE